MKSKKKKIIIQGHRGCTGYYPENSIAGFLYAIDLGVTSLEMDIVISEKDDVIVSHDPYFRSDISLDKNGNSISKNKESEHNINRMSLSEIKKFTCINNPNIPSQNPHIHSKPTLQELVKSIKDHCNSKGYSYPSLTIEVKSKNEWDSLYYPSIEYFGKVMDKFDKKYLNDFKVLYQSFDFRILEFLYEKGYEKIDLLIDEIKVDLDEIITVLPFKPSGLGIKHELISKEVVNYCENNNLTLSTWTVNSQIHIEKLLKLGVKNIITDYPLLGIKTVEKNNLSVQ